MITISSNLPNKTISVKEYRDDTVYNTYEVTTDNNGDGSYSFRRGIWGYGEGYLIAEY